MKFKVLKAAVAGLVLLNSSVASATLIESINNLNPGDRYRVLFVTSTLRDAFSSNIADYTNHVTQAANFGVITGSLGLTWSALASTETANVQTNTGILSSDSAEVSFFNTSGELVALSGSDLWDGSIANGISYNEDGDEQRDYVWTGMDDRGITVGRLGRSLATLAVSGRTNGEWANGWLSGISHQRALYGVSQVTSIPHTIDVPEPGIVILLSLGLAGLFMSRHRKQS
jgi:hypothetical protein